MNKKESLALFAQGKDAWNAWAEGMLDEKKRLQDVGAWEAERDRWEGEAKADFQNYAFENATFFGNYVFPGSAWFHRTKFFGDAWFHGAVFFNKALFRSAIFSSYAGFNETVFADETFFHGVTFSGNAWFERAKFFGPVRFNAVFGRYAYFSNAKFIANPNNPKAIAHVADFKAINCAHFFSLNGAKFEQVPDFTQAHFLEAPSLDNIIIGPKARENPTPVATNPTSPHGEPVEPRVGGGKQAAILRQAQDEEKGRAKRDAAEKAEIPTRWRHLRRLATQGQDHQNEQYFFAEELKSRRGVFDHQFGKNWQNWWAGWLYQIFSDFGRSIWRPLWIWGISTAIFAASYLLANSILKFGDTWPGKFECFNSSANPIWSALNLSVSRSLVLGGQLAQEGVSRSLQCLYGTDGRPFEIGKPIVHLPGWIVVSGYVQPIFSATMIFLVLLAIRNQFRIR